MNQVPRLSPVPGDFFERDTAAVARALLGLWLVHYTAEGPAGGVIVETEAYRDHDDPASHAHRGVTSRNRAMFEDSGRAYVYFIYGNHFCLNVVAHTPGRAGAVLLRALEPQVGVELMAGRRGRRKAVELASGPGKLCQALGVGKEQYGQPFLPPTGGRGLVLGAPREGSPFRTAVGHRVGIRAAREAPLRFWADGNPHVSRAGIARV